MKTMESTPTTFVYECLCEENPCICHVDTQPDTLVHVEVDPEGQSHIWPYTSEMRNRDYHPEWRDEAK